MGGRVQGPVDALVIEDEVVVCSTLLSMLKSCGFQARRAHECTKPESPQGCDLRCCGGEAPDLAVVAVIGPRLCSGTEAALKMASKWPSTKILLISASPVSAWSDSVQAALDRLSPTSYSFLPKPFAVGELRRAAAHLLGMPRE